MYWKAVTMKYEGEDRVRIGILLFETLRDEAFMFGVFGALICNGIKRKWRNPMKIKRWLLYDSHSYPYAFKFSRKSFFNDPAKITELGKIEMLYGFDRDIIIKKFPSMTKGWVEAKRKKKRK